MQNSLHIYLACNDGLTSITGDVSMKLILHRYLQRKAEGRRQKAEGILLPVLLKKTLVLGLKPSLKKDVFRDA